MKDDRNEATKEHLFMFKILWENIYIYLINSSIIEYKSLGLLTEYLLISSTLTFIPGSEKLTHPN